MANKDGQFYRELGAKLRRVRGNVGLTQEALASAVSLTRTSIVNIEKGRQKVLAHTLAALARALNVSVADLLPAEPKDLALDHLLRNKPKPAQEFVRSALASSSKE